MAQSEISDLSETDSSNTTVSDWSTDGSIANMSTTDNVFQAILGMLKRWFKTTLFRLRDAADQSKLLAFNIAGFTTGTTRTITVPDRDINLGDFAPLNPPVAAKSANYTVLVADNASAIVVDASGGSRTVSLPAAATAGNGFRIIVQKTDTSANPVVIDGNASETIDGATTKSLRLQYQSMALICDGTGWRVMGEGTIFESGTGVNGDYVKWSNGWATCTKTITPGLATSTASGSIFISASIVGGLLPLTFTSVPVVTANGSNATGNGWTLLVVIPTTTTWGTYRHASAVTDAATGGVLYLTAMGKWF